MTTAYEYITENVLVTKISGYKQKSGFQNAHGRCWGHRIEIFQFNFRHNIVIRFEGYFEYITLFGLQQKEE